MSELDISESHIPKNIKNAKYSRKSLKKITGLINRHSENFCYIFSFKLYLKCLRIIASSSTGFTLNIDIWKKMHFYFLHSRSFTELTASSFCIKRKSSWPISSLLRLMRSCKNFSNIRKNGCICSYV